VSVQIPKIMERMSP